MQALEKGFASWELWGEGDASWGLSGEGWESQGLVKYLMC